MKSIVRNGWRCAFVCISTNMQFNVNLCVFIDLMKRVRHTSRTVKYRAVRIICTTIDSTLIIIVAIPNGTTCYSRIETIYRASCHDKLVLFTFFDFVVVVVVVHVTFGYVLMYQLAFVFGPSRFEKLALQFTYFMITKVISGFLREIHISSMIPIITQNHSRNG